MTLSIPRYVKINAVFIILLAVFTSGFLWSFYLQKENNLNIDRFNRSTNWYANRILYQSENFLYKAHLYRLDATSLSDLTDSYNLVWNRLQLFLESKTTEQLRSQHPDLTQDVKALFSSITALEDDFNHPDYLRSEPFTEKIKHIKNELLDLNYSLSRILADSLSEDIRKNNDLIQLWQISVFIVTVMLSTALLRMTRQSSKLATLDPLTQLGNRRALKQYLTKHLKRKTKLTVAAIDLKRFKQINDQIGYQVGDTVLTTFAEKLSAVKNGMAFRLGGDEFVLVSHQPETQDKPLEWIHQLQHILEFDFPLEDDVIPIRHRLGLTYTNKSHSPNASTLLDQAIHALNETKQVNDKDYAFYQEARVRLDKNKLNIDKIKNWMLNPKHPCPLTVRLTPFYNSDCIQDEVLDFQLTWKSDNSLCSFEWLCEQHIYKKTIPALLNLANQQTTKPILMRLPNSSFLEPSLQSIDLNTLTSAVILGLPNLSGVSTPLINQLKRSEFKIALENINMDNLEEISELGFINYWIPTHLPHDPEKQNALLSLARAFNQTTLLQHQVINRIAKVKRVKQVIN